MRNYSSWENVFFTFSSKYDQLEMFHVLILTTNFAYGLWFEEDWAMNLAYVDAIGGIAICGIVMIVLPILLPEEGFGFTMRLELAALIPYLIKVAALRKVW